MKYRLATFTALFLLAATAVISAAVKAEQVRNALDLPASVTVSAPGTFGGSANAWSVVSSNDIMADADVQKCVYGGNVTCTGDTCLMVQTPSSAGYERYYNERKRNYITLTVKGTGTLKFRYCTSVAYMHESALWIYEYDGDPSKRMDICDYDTPAEEANDKNPVTINESYIEHFMEGEAWNEYNDDPYAWDTGGLKASEFWQEAEIDLGSDKYIHTLVIAALGPAKYDFNGDLIPDEYSEYEEVAAGKIYLDNFVWEPEDPAVAPRVVVFSEPDGTLFANKMLLTLSTDYDESEFRFFYTTDGSTPTTSSTEYMIYDPEDTNGDLDMDIDNNYGIILTADTTVKVLATERESGETVGIYSASYSYSVLPSPEIEVIPEAGFNDRTEIKFSGSYHEFNYWTFFYTLDGTEPTTASASGVGFTLHNSDLAGKTLKVLAVVNDSLTSESTTLVLNRTAPPAVTWKIDGSTADQEERVFTDKVEAVFVREEDISYTCSPQNGTRTSKGSIVIVAAAKGKLASEQVTATFSKATVLYDTDPETIAGGEEKDTDGWVTYSFPGLVKAADAETLRGWLKPFELNSTTGSWQRVSAIRPAVPYFIYLPQVDFENPPTGIRYVSPDDNLSGAVSGKGWDFVTEDADVEWNGKAYVPAQDSTRSGWKQK